MIASGFGILVFQKDKFKNIVAISLIWFSIVIFVVSLNVGIYSKYLFILKEIEILSDSFMENALIIFEIIRIFILSSSLVIVAKMNNKNVLDKLDFKGEMK